MTSKTDVFKGAHWRQTEGMIAIQDPGWLGCIGDDKH